MRLNCACVTPCASVSSFEESGGLSHGCVRSSAARMGAAVASLAMTAVDYLVTEDDGDPVRDRGIRE